MKKIKLLTALSSLSLLGVANLSLTSCGGSGSDQKNQFTITLDKGEHGTLSQTSITVNKGKMWSEIKSSLPTPIVDTGWAFKEWTLNGSSISDSYEITSNITIVAQYSITDLFYLDTWENVCYYANQGLDIMKEHYGVTTFIGAYRTIILNGKSHIVRVIGENHDTITETNSLASLTFECETLVSDSNGDAIKSKWGWCEYPPRTTTNPNIISINLRSETPSGTGAWEKSALTMLAQENYVLFQNIKIVNKQYSYYYEPYPTQKEMKVSDYTANIFALTGSEMGFSGIQCGGTYQYYSGSNPKIKKDANGNIYPYWLYTCSGSGRGQSIDLSGSIVGKDEGTELGISFGFCI